MSIILIPPPPRISLVDANGNITRPWSNWLLNDVFKRLGGDVALSNDELEALTVATALAPAAMQQIDRQDPAPAPLPFIAPQDPHGRLEAVEAEVTRLRQLIEGLQQGNDL